MQKIKAAAFYSSHHLAGSTDFPSQISDANLLASPSMARRYFVCARRTISSPPSRRSSL